MSRMAGSLEDLKNYMAVLSDVRRAAIIVCDSIRIREHPNSEPSNAVVEEAPRCPICTFEYDDPTVVLAGCGHGMHLACSDTFTTASSSGTSEDPVYACPLCRGAFRKEDMVLLRGVVPHKSQAAAWRTVQLTGLWKALGGGARVGDRGIESGTDSLREQVDSLEIYLKAAFRNANDISYALGGAFHHFEAAIAAQLDTRVHVEGEVARIATLEKRVTKELDVRRKNLDERERKLLRKELQNTSFMMQCVGAARREEWTKLGHAHGDWRVRRNLERTLLGIGRTQKLLETTRKDLEIECNSLPRRAAASDVGGSNRAAVAATGATEGTVIDSQPGIDLNVSPLVGSRGSLEVLNVEESSDSGGENGVSDLPSNSGNGRGNTRLSLRRGAKRTKRNYRIE